MNSRICSRASKVDGTNSACAARETKLAPFETNDPSSCAPDPRMQSLVAPTRTCASDRMTAPRARCRPRSCGRTHKGFRAPRRSAPFSDTWSTRRFDSHGRNHIVFRYHIAFPYHLKTILQTSCSSFSSA